MAIEGDIDPRDGIGRQHHNRLARFGARQRLFELEDGQRTFESTRIDNSIAHIFIHRETSTRAKRLHPKNPSITNVNVY